MKQGDFRFSPRKVRKAGLPSTPYAKALRAAWENTPTLQRFRQVFGPRVTEYLLRTGLVTERGNAVLLSPEGKAVLSRCGYPFSQ